MKKHNPKKLKTILKLNEQYYANSDLTADNVRTEIDQSLEFIGDIKQNMVTIFGSSKLSPSDPDCRNAKKVATKLGKLGYAIITGGGPGIMRAGNEGALAAKTESIGMQVKLIRNERVPSKLFTRRYVFNYIFARRFVMSIKSDAMIFYPGGYGTLNELFEFVLLEQLGMIDRVPLVLVNSSFWRGMVEWLKNVPVMRGTLNVESLQLLHIVDDEDEIIKHVVGKLKI